MNIAMILIVVMMLGLVALRSTQKKSAVTTEGVSVEDTQAALTRSKTERFALIARVFRGRKDASLIERNLTTAGLLVKPTEFIVMNLGFLVIVVLGVLVMLNKWPNDGGFFTMVRRIGISGALIWYVGWKGPQSVLQFMANSRRGKLEIQLADALTIISSSLKGGYSFVQGLNMAGEQMEPPIKDEIQRVMRLIQLGLDTPKALSQMSDRINSYDYEMTVSATNIQLAVGGNLSLLLEGIAATIRDRIRLKRDIGALTAQGRISGTMLFMLPIGIAFFLCGVNWEYMSSLFTATGFILLYVAGAMQAMGFFWIKKLLDFDS
ncbi:tight adherence protein B [Abditibacterium utsteinense]|uniref:Tight adherence protein B n=1 Tax=Abditibacterium utsteinense TaxID=1960156 RepID=A0A2S8SVR3_9BACT|nr:type II secretion system F family protein [Abditibacterium utsteinense]PQV64890.1 tight adherence protein B [Abditibacterium utsteinense]